MEIIRKRSLSFVISAGKKRGEKYFLHHPNARFHSSAFLKNAHFDELPNTNTEIHPTAIIHPGAKIGAGVKIGAFSVIESGVELCENVVVKSHAVISGQTKIGANSTVFSFACLGSVPQDKKFMANDLDSQLEIGEDCVIREHVTINGGTKQGNFLTSIGNNCWILTGSHIGHDCSIGNGVVLSNNVCLAGHVKVDNLATIGGQVGVKQFVHVGSLSMIGAKSAVEKDVIPYGLVFGNRATLKGLNLIGLRRYKAPRDQIKFLLSTLRCIMNPAVQANSSILTSSSFARPLGIPHHHQDTLMTRSKKVESFISKNGLQESNPFAGNLVKFILNSRSLTLP